MSNKDNITLFHGSYTEVIKPDLSKSRKSVDFGKGFYLTEDIVMAKKWASNKSKSVLNTYNITLDGLNIKKFELDEDWLNAISYYRENLGYNPNLEKYDVVIEPTANDKMFEVIELYFDEYISAELAINILNCLKYSDQTVLRSKKAIDKLDFVKSKSIVGMEKQHYKELLIADRIEASILTKKMLKEGR